MPHVIIGHTTSDSVRVWVKGDAVNTTCTVKLQPAPDGAPPEAPPPVSVSLLPACDYASAISVVGLKADRAYAVLATFEPSGVRVRGRARTIAKPVDTPLSFSFVLSSCNLSVVSINDFLSRLATTAGASLAMSSLDIPPYRWRRPKSRFWQAVFRPLATLALGFVAKEIEKATGLKQTGSVYLRSPFLKLSAVFESLVIDLQLPPQPPKEKPASKPSGVARNATPPVQTPADDDEMRMGYARQMARLFLAVGDHVETSSGATGVVASMRDDLEKNIRRLVLTQVDGGFETGAVLFREVVSERRRTLRRLAPIVAVRKGWQWYDPPAFFIHAGDQIYYDFPEPQREPDFEQYRMAYRDAWFEDDALRHLLAHWPHYMTLDDHEVADQFALDFHSPTASDPDKYLRQSTQAYREYAHALSPQPEGRAEPPATGPFWFKFDTGGTHFFVMDTRTQRRNQQGQIIDEEQLSAFLCWLSCHRSDLKFVVTSVPFVAELNRSAANEGWFDENRTRNSEHDKWSAPRFSAQRRRIIEHIAAKRIEHLVFLTGDMHCCYHATMRIGTGTTRYESIVVHELAGGPVNQLQLARATDFEQHCQARTGEDQGQSVDYEVTLERFHGDVSAVMHVKVDYVSRDRVVDHGGGDAGGAPVLDAVRQVVPEVEWSVIRTLTDPGPEGWYEEPKPTAGDQQPAKSVLPRGEPVMNGRISFARQRAPEELSRWP